MVNRKPRLLQRADGGALLPSGLGQALPALRPLRPRLQRPLSQAPSLPDMPQLRSTPAAGRCSTDNLLLCPRCDSDAYASSAVSDAHRRSPVDAFSGCLSTSEIASAWGVHLEVKKPEMPMELIADWTFDSWTFRSAEGVILTDLMVPSGNRIISSNETCGEPKRQSLRCGKQKDIILKQLMELSKRELMEMDCNGGGGGAGGENEGPAVLNRRA